MGAIIKISKKSKAEDIHKALLKLAGTKKIKKKLSDFYGALPNTFEDGLTYQQKQRNEWR